MKRGQLTIIIIITVVIVLGISSIFFFMNSKSKVQSRQESQFQDYMDGCIEDVINQAIRDFDENPIIFDAYKSNNVEELITSSLEQRIVSLLEPCVKNYQPEITLEENTQLYSVDIQMFSETTTFEVNYPVKIKESDSTIFVDTYNPLTLDIRLEPVISVINAIVTDQEEHPETVCFSCMADFAEVKDLYVVVSPLENTTEAYLFEVQDYTYGSQKEYFSIYYTIIYGGFNETIN